MGFSILGVVQEARIHGENVLESSIPAPVGKRGKLYMFQRANNRVCFFSDFGLLQPVSGYFLKRSFALGLAFRATPKSPDVSK